MWMDAVILSIGDELVRGQTVDTNSAWLSVELAKLGIGTLYHKTVGDGQSHITQAIREAAAAGSLVMVTGGLGPTDDDLTRQGLAEALGVPLVFHEESLEAISAIFARRNRPMPEQNRIQAMYPQGGEVIANSCGTAPGIKAKLDGATVYVTPGVPHEMVAMFDHSIRGEVAESHGGLEVILTEKINTFGLGESTVGQKLGDLTDRDRNPLVGTTVGGGIVSVRIACQFADAKTADQQLRRTINDVEQSLGDFVFGRGDMSLGQALVDLLCRKALTISTAESCTGGLLGQMITDVPGASNVYAGGWVTYTDKMKTSQLGVDPGLIANHGAVSEAVACAMAKGALERSGSDISIGVTGIAGPGGGSANKPVGTVWVAMVTGCVGENSTIKSAAQLLNLAGHRTAIRDRAAKYALQMIRLHLMGGNEMS